MSQGRAAHSDSTESRKIFLEVADSPQYKQVRSRFRNFAFPMTVAGLGSFFVFVVLSIYAVDFMSQPFPGFKAINNGIVIGIVQFAIVYIWTAIYVNYMNKRVDPASESIKEELVERGAV